jgi:hypothetical protein
LGQAFAVINHVDRFKNLKHMIGNIRLHLSTDLLRGEPVRDGYLTPEVEFTHYQAFRRVCHTCFDLDE